MVRSTLPLLIVAIGSATALFGCSGATQTDFFAPVSEDASLAQADPTGKSVGDDDGVFEDDDDDGTDLAPEASAETDDDEPRDLPSPNGCPSEAENNDVEARATSFATCINGVVDDGNDVDFLRVVAPAEATLMHIRHEESAKLVYRVSVEDRLPLPLPLPGDGLFSEEDATVRVDGGRAYLIRVSIPTTWSGKKSARSYQVRVDFQ